MPINIEIKARLNDPDAALAKLCQLAGHAPEVLDQEDVFFGVERGRLKMRCDPKGVCELIYYRRDDQPGPRLSSYFRRPVKDAERETAELAKLFGVRSRIHKNRLLFNLGGARVHVDFVRDLGAFIEIEVPVSTGGSPAQARTAAVRLMRELGIGSEVLVPEAYEQISGASTILPSQKLG